MVCETAGYRFGFVEVVERGEDLSSLGARRFSVRGSETNDRMGASDRGIVVVMRMNGFQ